MKNEKKFVLRLPESLYNVLRDLAEYKGISINALILSILWGVHHAE